MVHKNGNRYPKEFKQQIIELYHAGVPVAKLAKKTIFLYSILWLLVLVDLLTIIIAKYD